MVCSWREKLRALLGQLLSVSIDLIRRRVLFEEDEAAEFGRGYLGTIVNHCCLSVVDAWIDGIIA